MALSAISGVSNATLWDLARKASPAFKSHTAKATADLFTDKGFEALRRSDVGAINEFFEVSLRIAFQMVNISRAKNLFESKGLLAVYDTTNGGYVQRMAINSIRPVSPAYKGLQNGDSVDPFVVRKPEVSERFFQQNFDYQSFITVQDFQVKTIFVSEYGMGSFLAGVMQALENGYTIQESLNVKEAINKALNSTAYALQDTQVARVAGWTDADVTAEQLADLLLLIKNIVTAMTVTEQTSAYNAAKFATVVDTSDLVLVMRAGIKNQIDLKLEVGAFNPDKLSTGLDIIEVDNFGGLVPYVLSGTTHVAQQPVYYSSGEVAGYIDASVTVNGPVFKSGNQWLVNVTSGATTADTTYNAESALDGWDDPNEDVIAIIAQKGLVFENKQNPYEVSPIYNPRGLYRNYWASSPNNAIVVDPVYQMVAIMKPDANA